MRLEAAVIFGPIRQEFQCRLVGWTPSIGLPSRCFLFCFLLLISFVHASAQEKKAWGEVFDREALGWVKTVCVDTSDLEGEEGGEVKEFVAKESQPGHLLRRMPWELTDQCAGADAVIRMYFSQATIKHTTAMPCSDQFLTGCGKTAVSFEQGVLTVLLIYDRASVRVLYRTEGRGERTKRLALKGSFTELAKDLKRAQLSTAPPGAPKR
jgi:hypothetical protein